MKIETLHQHFLESTGICTDTRKITKGCIFIALKGDNFNGNKFTHEALKKGAYKVIIDEIGYHKNTGETILCADSLTLLQKLAGYHRSYLNIPIIALTGSNGKTTTKELINAILSESFNTVATKGNLNNHIGVPLTLLSMDTSTELGIVEMGANHIGEIAQLCKIANPDYGYITNFGKAHLEGFGSMEGVIQGKTELYKHLKANNKSVFINNNDQLQILNSKDIQKIVFGKNDGDYLIQLKEASSKLLVHFEGIDMQSNLIGLYNFHNIAAAIAIGAFFKVSSEKIKHAIEALVPDNNRSQLIEQGTNKIILDAYNANPTSMMAALENFAQSEGTPKILFLGDMFEVGADALKEHQAIVDFIETSIFEKVFLIGKTFSKTSGKNVSIVRFESFEAVSEALKTSSIMNSYLLIKASRGMALERILPLL
ncbi:UDP-N-acetylmuramoyl-tripeptide--D-alanyl-D-alanine ligase [Ulvibacter antarcticus]|uniref:UDP-N-acetylmuramoyl-tripeptide--D-alanyl-D-alanine ligase n=1 Tax=Ulvibacter antarcticus TaxID=442714 RepID=A0A3L9YCC6_9FLAO|nr:UDP-N-acetylmuramoyl-tripeptide--D-alanyl-D-alanine ligase [Ulvibacter antarcticus]RMA57147.1 UDP-N-acetylmuramoyl-tripeptide--D-alanyl-D-alanine ligase [Ulvibacter antarcticus]